MATSKGKDGGFYVGSTIVTFMDSWTLNRGVQIEDVTSFGSDWDQAEATVKNWNASFSGTLDRTDAQQAALLDQLEDGAIADVAVRLATAGSTSFWSGSAIYASDSINSTTKGLVKISGNLTGNGALAYTP